MIKELSSHTSWSIEPYLGAISKELHSKLIIKYAEIQDFSKLFFESLSSAAFKKLDEADLSQEAIHLGCDKKGRNWPFAVQVNRGGEAFALAKLLLAKGGESKIGFAVHLQSGCLVVYRKTVIEKSCLKKNRHKQRILRDVTIHRTMSGSQVPTFIHACEASSEKHYYVHYIMMKYCEHGDLWNYQALRKNDLPSLDPFSHLWNPIKDIIQALADLHDEGWEHRDVKLNNMLLTQNGERLVGMLGDFGLAYPVKEEMDDNYFTGSLRSMSPEVIKTYQLMLKKRKDSTVTETQRQKLKDTAFPERVNFKRDGWSLGVALFILCRHELPSFIKIRHKKQISENVINITTYDVSRECYHLKTPLKSMITQLLSIDPNKRPSMNECLKQMSVIEHKYTSNKTTVH